MEQNDSQQLLLAILNHAHKDPPLKFTYILSWDKYRYFQRFEKSARIVIKVLKSAADKLIKEYCKNVIAGISDMTQLLAYSEIAEVTEFYENELITVTKMLDEYNDYLWHGNFLYAFLGGRRDDQ